MSLKHTHLTFLRLRCILVPKGSCSGPHLFLPRLRGLKLKNLTKACLLLCLLAGSLLSCSLSSTVSYNGTPVVSLTAVTP